MTVSRINVRIPTRFPSSVSVSDPLTLDRAGGAFAFAIDLNALESALGIVYQPLEATLTALASIGSTAGLLVQTAGDVFAQRTITGTANEITATNGSGAAGNPTLSLPAAMTFTGKTVTGGTFSGITITTSTFNGNTWTAGTGILTIAASKTATFSNTLTFSGTDASSIAFGTGGTVAYVANKLSAFAATTSLEFKGVISDETGSGALVFGTAPTLNQPNIVGTITNDSAAAGSVGEYVEGTRAVGSALSISSATPTTIASISLTAGDWDVDAVLIHNPNTSTSITGIGASIVTTTNTIDTTTPGRQAFEARTAQVPGNVNITGSIPATRFSLASTTTIYLTANDNFTVSTMLVWGIIRARRVR